MGFWKRLFTKGGPITPITPGRSSKTNPFFNIEIFSTATIIRNYEDCSPLYGAVEKIAGSVGGLPVMLQDKITKERIEDHPALARMKYPNKEFQKIGSEFFEYSARWFILEGDLFWLIRGSEGSNPVSVEVLNSSYITVEPTFDGRFGTRLLRYFHNGTQELFDYEEKTGTFWSQDGRRNRQIAHIANFNVRHGQHCYDGTSEIRPLYYEILQTMKVSKHTVLLLENGLRPSGAFFLKSPNGQPVNLTEAQTKLLKEEIDRAYAGALNTGRPVLVPADMDYKELSLNVKDMDFPKLQEYCQNRIYSGLGVPPQLVAADKTTAGNMDNIRAEFYHSRVVPFACNLLAYYNLFVLSRYRDGSRYEFVVDRMAVDVLIPTEQLRMNLIEGSGSLTIDGKRKKAWNLEPIEGGDAIRDPNGRFIAGKLGPADTLQMSTAGSAESAKTPVK